MATQTAPATALEIGKVYCIDFASALDDDCKRLVRYDGENKPWTDICSGKQDRIDPECIKDVVEVPQNIVEAIEMAQANRPLSDYLTGANLEEVGEDAWERDIYCDDWDD